MDALLPSKQGRTRYLARNVAMRYGVVLLSADRAAAKYRRENNYNAGLVLVWAGEVAGWCNCLRNPEHNRPGMLAIDADGNAWIAAGGNDQAGASEWIQLVTVTPPAQAVAK